MIYNSFAKLYDDLFDPVQYDRWLAYTEKRLSPHVHQILDLAGGSGRLSVKLAQNGYQVVDLDFSSAMLSLADQHAREAGVSIGLVQADMRDLDDLPGFDAVVSYADSLCYLPDFEAVKTTLSQVSAHLSKGGRLLFDVWSTYQTDQVFPGYCYNMEADDDSQSFLWRSYADDDITHGVIHELTFFTRNDDGRYSRQHETHFERTYPLAQWKLALSAAGFNKVDVRANFGVSEPSAKTTRWFFDCQKG